MICVQIYTYLIPEFNILFCLISEKKYLTDLIVAQRDPLLFFFISIILSHWFLFA